MSLVRGRVEERKQLALLGGHGGLGAFATGGGTGHVIEDRGQFRRDGALGRQAAAGLSTLEELGQAFPALADGLLLAGQVGVELGENLVQVLTGVVGEGVADLVQAQAKLGQPAYAGQLDGVAQAVLAVAVGLPLGLGQQADAVVVPHRAG